MGNVETIHSRNGKLQVGMTRESLKQKVVSMGLTESDKAAKKLAEAFNMADGLGENGIKDGIISDSEIMAYDKEIKKKNVKTAVLIGVGVVTAVVAGIAIARGIKMKNANKMLNFDDALKADAAKGFADVVPDNYKGKGVSYLVNAEASATPSWKLKMGKTIGETLELNKGVGLELVQEAGTGKYVYGVKNPWTGWENLPNWKNEYGSLSFQELKKLYPDINGDMYFRPAGPGMIKAYSAQVAEDGAVAIGKAYNGVADIAFQANATAGKKGAKHLVDITHVLDDGSAIKFDDLADGWNHVRKGQFNPANPSKPLPLTQTAIGFSGSRTVSTLEGPIVTDFAMTDGGGFPYNKFKDFWKQLVRHKVEVNPNDPNSVKMFEYFRKWESLSTKAEELKTAGNSVDLASIESKMATYQDAIKKLIIQTT